MFNLKLGWSCIFSEISRQCVPISYVYWEERRNVKLGSLSRFYSQYLTVKENSRSTRVSLDISADKSIAFSYFPSLSRNSPARTRFGCRAGVFPGQSRWITRCDQVVSWGPPVRSGIHCKHQSGKVRVVYKWCSRFIYVGLLLSYDTKSFNVS